jgi:hypothetical protein
MTVYFKTIETQIKKNVALGFSSLLQVSDFEYINFFERAFPKSLKLSSLPGLPVIADPRINIDNQLNCAKVKSFLNTKDIENVCGRITEPYLFFIGDYNRFNNLSPEASQNNFNNDETGCTFLEVLSIYMHYGSIFNGIAIDAVQSKYRNEYHPSFVGVTEQLEIGAHWYKDKTPRMNTISKSKLLIKI